MVYIYVDIRYYPQLARVDQARMEGILAGVDRALASANGRALSALPPLLYAFDDSAAGSGLQVSQAAFAAFECLRSASERLSGCTVLIEKMDEAGPDEATRAFKSMRFPPETVDTMIVGPRARGPVSEYFSVADSRTPGEVVDFTFSRPVSSDENQAFWERRSLVDAVMRAIDPLLSGETGERVLVLPFKRESAPMRCVERAIRPFSGPFAVPLVRPRPEAQNPFAPAVSAHSRADAAVAFGRLSLGEQAAMDSARAAFELVSASPRQKTFPSEVTRRLAAYLELFLAGLARDRRARGHEAFLLVEDADRVPASCMQAIARALSPLQGENAPIVVATCEDPSVLPFPAPRIVALPAGIEAAMAGDAEAYAASLDPGDGPREGARAIAAELGSRPLAMYHALLSGRASRNPTRAFLSDQPPELLEILYVSHLASGVLERKLLDDFFSESGIRPQTQGMAYHQLFRMGLVLSEDDREPSSAETMADIEIILGDRAKEARSRLSAFMESRAQKGQIRHSLPTTKPPASAPVLAAEEALANALGPSMASDERAASDFIKAVRALPPSSPLADEARCLEAWALFERAGLRRSLQEASAAVSALDAAHEDARCAFRGHRAILKCSLALAEGRDRDALARAKEALIAFQSGGSRGEARANRLLGLHSLREGLFLDAMDYFANAYLVAVSAGDELECLLSSYYEGVTFYLFGNLSRALRLSHRALAHAAKAFRTDWEVQASLLAARIESDFGRADRALDALEACLAVLRLSPWDPAERRVRAWMARMMARAGSPAGALALLDRLGSDPEASFFRSEALLAAGDAEGALAAARAASAAAPDRTPYFTDAPGFGSGAELVEDCVAPPPGGSSPFRLAALAAEAEALRRLGRAQESAEAFHAATRDPALRECDPAIHEYLYRYFLALPDGFSAGPRDERLSDRGTVLSRAFKYLQLRASRIDTAEDKNDFMLGNRLNRELTETARGFKFI